MNNNTATLPWPPKELNPNQLRRLHWSVRSKKMSEYKDACYLIAKVSGIKPVKNPLLLIDFYPPNKARRDVDNCLSACKAGIDGLALALGMDDSLFKNYHIRLMDQIGGMVKVRLQENESI